MRLEDLKKDYDPSLFKDPFSVINNSPSRHRQMCLLMDSDPETEEFRLDDWYNFYRDKYFVF